MSPDNKDVYVAGGGENGEGAIAGFEREAGTGALTQFPAQAGCISTSNKACAPGTAINGPEDLAISPDGKNIYANSHNDDAVIELDRNPETGFVTQLGCIASSVTTETEDARRSNPSAELSAWRSAPAVRTSTSAASTKTPSRRSNGTP